MGVLPYEGERFQGSVGVLRDVTDRKERERALQVAKDRYQLLVEQNLLGLYIARGGTLVYHNERFGELFGSPAESNVLAGESLFSLVEAADRDRLAENVARVEADQGASLREPYVGRRRDGGAVNVELLARGIELDDEPAVIGTVVDVNDENERLWQLRHERDRLDQFTSIVSHDLRNPLNVAQGHLELARTEDGATDESLSTVADALVRMDELLNELLTLARQGEVVSDREAVDLRSVAESTWGNVATADATLSVPAEAHIDADPGRVKGVFENLYRNSVEHAGHDVTVRVGTLDDGFYVEDDGPGIPPADRDRVFESGYTTAGDGTGFGLAIVAEIVEAHGWRIAAVEGRDRGSRFEIRAGDRPVLHES
jgi:PAS domain S-box-containing protein